MDRKEKEIRENLGEISEKMQGILAKAENESRDLNKDENERFEGLKADWAAKERTLENYLATQKTKKFGEAPAEQSLRTITGDTKELVAQNGTPKSGRALDESGNVRLYSPQQRLAADHAPEGVGSDVDLGDYLRAVVQKPRNQAERDIVQRSVTSGDYHLPVHIAAELIDRLRTVNPLLNGGGARTISLEGGETKFVKTNSDPDAVWHSELVKETSSPPDFGAISMDPKTVMSVVSLSNELLQDSNNVAEALTKAFVGSLNEAILDATFTGSGTATEPEGLSTIVTQTETYTNGETPDWPQFVGASRQLHDNNVPTDNRSFIHAPDVWENLALVTDSNGRYQDAPSFIRDVPNLVSSGLTAGQAYVGDFSNVVYGFRLNINIKPYDARIADSYGVMFIASARLDIATFRPNALVRIEEASA